MRAREFLQLLGLGPGIRFYPFKLDDISQTFKFRWINWLVPKSPPKPDVDKEATFYSKFLTSGDWTIDIGAHLGDSTVGPALACGREGGVLAFEPNPTTFHILSLQAALNREVTNILAIPFAAGDRDAYLTFEYGDHWCSNGGHHDVSKWVHGGAYSVFVYQVDVLKYLETNYSALLDKVRFIKVDAEAMDWIILENLRPLIELARPCLKLEIGETEEGQTRGLRFLDSLGYDGYELDGLNLDSRFECYIPRKGSFDIFACARGSSIPEQMGCAQDY